MRGEVISVYLCSTTIESGHVAAELGHVDVTVPICLESEILRMGWASQDTKSKTTSLCQEIGEQW